MGQSCQPHLPPTGLTTCCDRQQKPFRKEKSCFTHVQFMLLLLYRAMHVPENVMLILNIISKGNLFLNIYANRILVWVTSNSISLLAGAAYVHTYISA